ncbi:MAG: DDE-type integrase/transposase/recombinase [Actinomycetia bacterium]|nr:DDE-type integrase/transposase/recombinase [Actinomycetes bacterium]
MGPTLHPPPHRHGTPCRHAVGDRWFVDKTYVKASGVWRYVYRAVDQHGHVIDIYVSKRPNITAATHFIETMLTSHGDPQRSPPTWPHPCYALSKS